MRAVYCTADKNNFPAKNSSGYSTAPLEFEAFLRDFQRKNPSGTAFAPFAKRIQHGRTQVTIHALDRA